jgi:hypothetical protein
MVIADRLKALREQKNMSQGDTRNARGCSVAIFPAEQKMVRKNSAAFGPEISGDCDPFPSPQ